MSVIKTETAERLRERLCDLTASEAERRADAERLAGELEGQIREAEHRERAEAARAELLRQAAERDAEARRLDALADERRTVLADVDAEIAKLTEQRMAMERAMQVDADLAERVLTSDPEEAGRLAGANVGRSQALAGLAARIAATEPKRQEIEERYSLPNGVGQADGTLLFSPLTTGTLTERAAAEREEAARLRAKAASDPLAERPPERPEAAALTPTGMVMAGVALALRLPDLFPPEPGPRNPFGYAPGTIAEAAASRPRRGRR
jgi:hypothetical protein